MSVTDSNVRQYSPDLKTKKLQTTSSNRIKYSECKWIALYSLHRVFLVSLISLLPSRYLNFTLYAICAHRSWFMIGQGFREFNVLLSKNESSKVIDAPSIINNFETTFIWETVQKLLTKSFHLLARRWIQKYPKKSALNMWVVINLYVLQIRPTSPSTT